MIDVGCSGGLHPIFERFGPDILAHGFDPVIVECERLAAAETARPLSCGGRGKISVPTLP
jgi:hypothetical protein